MRTNKIINIAAGAHAPFPYYDIDLTTTGITAAAGQNKVIIGGGNAGQIAQIERGDYLLLFKSVGQSTTHILTGGFSLNAGNYTLGLRADTPIVYATPTKAYLCKKNSINAESACKRMQLVYGDATSTGSVYINDQRLSHSNPIRGAIVLPIEIFHPVIIEVQTITSIAVVNN